MAAILHSNDLLGKTVAAITSAHDTTARLIKSNYSTPPDRLRNKETIYALGMFYNYNCLKRLANSHELYVFSNNKNVIADCNKLIEEGYVIKGERKIDESPILTSWQHFFPNKKTPKAISYLSDYHLWKFDLDDSLAFYLGLDQYNIKNVKDSIIWDLITMDDAKLLKYIVSSGNEILEYDDIKNKELCDDLAFYTKLQGFFALAINVRKNSRILTAHYNNEAPKLYINFEWIKDHYTVSLYANDENIHVGNIARKYGGGGHKGVGSFRCNKLPFELGKKKVNEDSDNTDRIYTNPYANSDSLKKKSFIIGKYVNSSDVKSTFIQHLYKRLWGHDSVIVNTTNYDISIFYPLQYINETIAVSYIYTNTGMYRYVVHNLTTKDIIKEIQSKVGGELINKKRTLVFYSKENYITGE